jgi:FtsP/CotA-like multicopper oxidase with cupredoxin domain
VQSLTVALWQCIDARLRLPQARLTLADFRFCYKSADDRGPFIMHKLSFHDALHAGRLFSSLTIAAVAVLVALACPDVSALAQTAETRTDPAIRSEFREPVTLTSKDGVLEVRLTARQGQATLDTVATPVQNVLVFDYELIRGTASDGRKSGGNLYPAPTLQVFPGERLVVHLENGLTGLTIRDYFSPQYTPSGRPVPIYPEQMTSSPINLHTHGAHISPKGNADNVLLHIPPGMSNTYTYDMPRNMPQGMFWYHPHLHGLTSAQVYTGLAGLLVVGRTDGNLPVVTEKSIPIRNMALQYNFVFDRAGGLAQLNNPSWPVGQLDNAAESQRAGGRHLPSIARAGELQPIEAGNEVLYGLVCRAAVNPEYARALPVHSQQPAALHRGGQS